MSQSYSTVLISGDGTVKTVCPLAYINGMKLMEHSYIGNNFVNAVLTQLWNHPMKVAWIGDYSDKELDDPYEAKLSHEEFMRYYDIACGKYRCSFCTPPIVCNVVGMDSHAFLVNHTKKCYIDIAEYIQQNKWIERYKDDNIDEEMCLNPLPLLTACGNARGGGDYQDCYPDYDKVGTWAFDLIECTDERPVGYEKYEPRFTEQC